MKVLAQVSRPPATTSMTARSRPVHEINLSSVARMMFTFSVGFPDLPKTLYLQAGAPGSALVGL
jgi:hypothetical protein